jgi:hypothetical protein
MIYRDRSAFTTLDNANEGIMSKSFEEWKKGYPLDWMDREAARDAWDARQPEIDELKRGGSLREVTYLKTEIQLMVEQREKLWLEIDALKVELSLRTHGESSARIRIKMLTNENAALKAETERLLPYVDAFRREEDWADKLDRQVDDLKAEVARLKADAERLDFLDSNKRFTMGWHVGVAPVGCISVRSIIHGELSIREAIDAAMKDNAGGSK